MAGLKKQKQSSIRILYLKNFALMILSFIASSIILFAIFGLLINLNFIYPANYPEEIITQLDNTVDSIYDINVSVEKDIISYTTFDKDFNIIDTTMNESCKNIALDIVKNKSISPMSYFYKKIQKKDGYCVFMYDLVSKYKSVFLRNHLLNPEKFFLLINFCSYVLLILVYSAVFGKTIKKYLSPLSQIIEKIKRQDLDYSFKYSGITEIDDLLSSIDDMKNALQTSLQAQWNSEANKNKQISAISHDIKTPLTVIKGNTELLFETKLDEEQKLYTNYIATAQDQIQSYIQLLMEASKATEQISFKPEALNIQILIDIIKKQVQGLAATKQINILWNQEISDIQINAEKQNLERAIINIISNAIEYSPNNSKIIISVIKENNFIKFIIEDSGKGFSEKGLLHATEQFYMEDTSRNNKNHYGIGLYTAKSVAERHNGFLLLENSKETSGAKVTIAFSTKL